MMEAKLDRIQLKFLHNIFISIKLTKLIELFAKSRFNFVYQKRVRFFYLAGNLGNTCESFKSWRQNHEILNETKCARCHPIKAETRRHSSCYRNHEDAEASKEIRCVSLNSTVDLNFFAHPLHLKMKIIIILIAIGQELETHFNNRQVEYTERYRKNERMINFSQVWYPTKSPNHQFSSYQLSR